MVFVKFLWPPRVPVVKLCVIRVVAGHEASPPAPAPLLGPPLIAPPPRRRQTAHPPRLAGWQRPPPDAATGRSAPESGRRRRQHRLRSAGRQPPEAPPEEDPGPPAPVPGRGGEPGRRGEDGGGAAVEAERGAAAVHRPDLPPAEEYDPDGEDGEPEGAGAAQPQSARRGREVKALFSFY